MIKVTGRVKEPTKKISYIAAAPATLGASYMGSGLPYPNRVQAFFNTPNKGEADVDESGKFEFYIYRPNSYMVGLGSVTIPPTVYVSYNGHSEPIVLDDAKIPYRHITYPNARTGPEFYNSQFNLVPKSQWVRLVESRVCGSQEASDYFGERPPH
jgi:hypothetical protein